jgi:diaminohydroxyphosphoribosylaminopyrimidine deaminase/5-amino-6-(5-phosphoribosylamino)uracil reductase
MRNALALARKGVGLSSPNPPVGCVIVRNGEVVGRGWHEYAQRDHAEVRALREASKSARGATAYVTLEPCCHQGRTPPCVDSLIQAGIRRVVAARPDPNPTVSGRGIDALRSAGIRVDTGILSEQAGELIEPFACHVTTGLPLVVCKVGMSLDGKIGTGRRTGRWVTSNEGREFGQSLRHEADALLVGIGTVLADNPELTCRGKAPKGRQLTRVILDPRLQTPPAARLFRDCACSPLLLFCGPQASPRRRGKLEGPGVEIVEVPCRSDEVGLKAVLRELGKRNILSLLVEGGSRVHWSFLSGRLVDKFYFIIAPLVLGGKQAVPSVGGKGYRSAEDSPKFKLHRCFNAGRDIVLVTYPSYSRSIISPWLSPESAPSDGQDFLPSSGRK